MVQAQGVVLTDTLEAERFHFVQGGLEDGGVVIGHGAEARPAHAPLQEDAELRAGVHGPHGLAVEPPVHLDAHDVLFALPELTVEKVMGEDGLRVEEVHGDTYNAYVMLIQDPSRVYLASSSTGP